jgi:hypothetical protein
LLAVPVTALAWGGEGHEVVALVADRLLTPEVRTRIAAILAVEPGATLASVWTWADQTRDRSTAAWPYVNLPRGADCQYVGPRVCPGGNCVVGALAAQVTRLTTATGQDQLEALKYIVHFVADIHQPFHAGLRTTRVATRSSCRPSAKGRTCTRSGTPRWSETSIPARRRWQRGSFPTGCRHRPGGLLPISGRRKVAGS